MKLETQRKLIRSTVEALENAKVKAVNLSGTHLILSVDAKDMETGEVQSILDHIEKTIARLPGRT